MARIRPLDREAAAPSARERMDRDLARYGHVMPTTGVYAHAPRIQEAGAALDAGIRDAGGISPQLRALMNVRVASMVGCPF